LADVYKIAVRIALANGMSPVLAIISRDLLGVHARVRDIEKSFGRWALAAGGGGAIMAGGAIIGGLARMAERGSEVNHQLELMKLQGMQVAEIHEAAARAMQVSGAVLTSTYSENLEHIRELRYAFGDTPDALKYLETVTKANATLNAMKGGGADQVWALVKSLEEKGLTASPDVMMSYVDQMTKAVVASGGKVTPEQFFSAFKFGRTAMLGWDETFVTQMLPRLIQSWSGGGGFSGTSGPGNALMSGFSTVVSGHMTKAAGMMWEKMGLATMEKIPGSSQVLTHVRQSLVDAFLKNPYEFAQQIAPDVIKAAGGKDQNKMIEVVGKMLQNRTAGAVITQMILQGRAVLGDQSPFEKDARLQREAFDQRMSYDELIKNDYQTMMKAFHSQWKSFNETIGAPLSEPGGPLVQVLADVTSLMHSVTARAQAHPEGIRIVADALAALAASLVIGGLVALGAAIAPLVGTGAILAALAAGLAAFAAVSWPAMETGVNSLIGWVDKMSKGVQGPINDWMKSHTPSGDAPIGNPAGDANPYQPSSYIPAPRGAQTLQVSTVLNVDGRKFAEAVTRHQVREANGPNRGAPYHDPTRSQAPIDFALA
jgi:hypothetical protein